jgi:hypothetical protein
MSDSTADYGEGAAWPQGAIAMETNRYALAGWLSVVAAAIFPAAMVMGWIQGIIGVKAFHYRGPMFGPADILFIGFTAISVYVLIKLKVLLNDRYQFHGLDLLIPIVIGFNILFQLASIALEGLIISVWPLTEKELTVVYIAFMVIFFVSAGIIDIIFAVLILKAKELLGNKLTLYAYLVLAGGIAELTIILLPVVAFLILPASFIVLATIFLGADKDELEFV